MFKFLKKALVVYVVIFSLVMGGAFLIGAIKNNNLYSMILSCKYNPSAPYTDKFYFSKDMSSISRTSDNKNFKGESYTIEKMSSDEYIIKGMKTDIDINKNETKHHNSKLYILNNEGFKYWTLYYFEDYDTDPFRFMVCNQS